MAVTYNTNTTATSSIAATATKQFYDKRLLENMKPLLIHNQFAQKRPVPAHGGKTIEFRKWTPFAALTTPLTEGVPPEGQTLNMTNMTATVAQYGGFVTISDLLDLTSIDSVKSDAVDMMAQQGALTLDTLAREELHKAPSVIYANAKTGRAQLAPADKLTSLEIRKAVRALKKVNAPMFRQGSKKGYYIAIIGPDTEFDLMDDPTWVDVSKYQDKENIYYGEIGMLYGCKVVCTSEAKIFSEAGADKADVASTLVFGQNAYGVVDIDGSSNVQSKIKPAGSAGSQDPLDQTSTVGWKVMAYVCKVLQPAFIQRIESGFSA